MNFIFSKDGSLLFNKNPNTLHICPFPESEDIVKKYYENHNTYHDGDAGLDLFCIQDQMIPFGKHSIKIDFGICVEHIVWNDSANTFYNEPLYLYPRSSTGSKTPLRLSNSVGIIDAGYRGQIMAHVDNISDKDFDIKQGERYFQLCSGNLRSMKPFLVEKLSSTERDTSGFGSTGK